MLGHTVFKYLSKNNKLTVFGTSRKKANKQILYLDVKSFNKDLNSILNIQKDIGYVINCIGELKDNNTKSLQLVNAIFPNRLSNWCLKYNLKLIHISSDAVFDKNIKIATEKTIAKPNTAYGKSKLNGEPNNKNSLSIRTSILGIDNINHSGILEWIINSKAKILPGFTNQVWSGATTLQIAKFCEELIIEEKFNAFRKLSKILHFAPLGPITKYEIIKNFITVASIKKSVEKDKGENINRVLKSDYLASKDYKIYVNNTKTAFKELLLFEKNIS
jgi:dTDP-4-dehydrorhamnose reductase